MVREVTGLAKKASAVCGAAGSDVPGRWGRCDELMSGSKAVRAAVFAMGCMSIAGRAMADRYGDRAQDLLLRYGPYEQDLALVWHVAFAAVFFVLLWRSKKRFDRADRGGALSSELSLGAWGGLWFGGAAGLEVLLALTDTGPWWGPGRQGR